MTRNGLSNMILALVLVLVVIGVTGAHRKIAELKEQVAELKNEVAEVKTENEGLKNKNATLEIVVDGITKMLVVNANAANKKIERLEKTAVTLKKQNKEHAAAIENTLAAITGLKKDLAEFKGYVNELNNANADNLILIVDKMNEIIDGHNGHEKKIIEMEKILTKLTEKKNKKRCPLPPWRKHKKE